MGDKIRLGRSVEVGELARRGESPPRSLRTASSRVFGGRVFGGHERRKRDGADSEVRDESQPIEKL